MIDHFYVHAVVPGTAASDEVQRRYQSVMAWLFLFGNKPLEA